MVVFGGTGAMPGRAVAACQVALTRRSVVGGLSVLRGFALPVVQAAEYERLAQVATNKINQHFLTYTR
jgi:hypothetical protein